MTQLVTLNEVLLATYTIRYQVEASKCSSRLLRRRTRLHLKKWLTNWRQRFVYLHLFRGPPPFDDIEIIDVSWWSEILLFYCNIGRTSRRSLHDLLASRYSDKVMQFKAISQRMTWLNTTWKWTRMGKSLESIGKNCNWAHWETYWPWILQGYASLDKGSIIMLRNRLSLLYRHGSNYNRGLLCQFKVQRSILAK